MLPPRGAADADKMEGRQRFPEIAVDNSYDFVRVLMLGGSDLY
jgi:hypothetical protein